ncbi:hypothetical protein D9756_007188 [Leucocoprinus leucothites]|uniref:NAD-dependent epimerase/dehydratase domain-containing protein n=1 Tax=Leucocoprinus leucothites TaxID=201217 RepID=A0A8H5FZ30_9AGAR|nr:hypothetical protein D9756_007188 [Leucoagaricus leucothites]
MPIIPKAPGDTRVLVTGVNGYIAIWVVHYLLEQGYFVRGTVRSEAKATPIREHFKEYHESGKFEVVVIPDSTQEGAYDTFVQDLDAIIHTASPVHDEAGEPSEIINPSVQATLSILKSALAHGPNIKRVIYTSSTGAIRRSAVVEESVPITKVYTEKDWNWESVELIKKLGKDANHADKYQSSKVYAEQAAWDFVKAHEAEIGWDLCVLNLGFTMGPFLQDWKDPASFNWTSKFFYDLVFDHTPKSKDLLEASHSSVDVRDVAIAHVLAIQKPEAGNERILLVGAFIVTHDWIEEANRLKPDFKFSKLSIVPPYPGIRKNYSAFYDNTKARQILGINFRGTEDMTRGLLEDYMRKGW